MELIDCPALGDELHVLHATDPRTLLAHVWRTPGEIRLIDDNGQLYVAQDKAVVPVDCHSRAARAVLLQPGLYCLVDVQGARLRVRRLDAGGPLGLDLQIGVDERIAAQLHAQRKTGAANVPDACAWLQAEFVLAGEPARLLGRSDDDSGRLTLLGLRHEAAVRENDGIWRLERLTPLRRGERRTVLIQGALTFIDAGTACALSSPAQRRQLQEHLDAHGDYVALWRRYATREWQRATGGARELGVLRYTRCEPAGDERLEWGFEVDATTARVFMERRAALQAEARDADAGLEACPESPAWLVDDTATRMRANGHPVVGLRPRLSGSVLTLEYAPGQYHDRPPATGVLCLSIHGERKMQERREQALERIRRGENPMVQLRNLLEGLPVPVRSDWRRHPALSGSARKAFRGDPTDRQRQALDVALNTPDIAVIIGPPGTGKTQVISALQRRLAEIFPDPAGLQHQVLITSFQHDALDNALARTEVFGLPPLRIGGRRQAAEAAEGDRLGVWCSEQRARLKPKLEAELAAHPVYVALDTLRERMVRLRVQALELHARQALAADIDADLQALAGQHQLRLTAALERRWREWRELLGEPVFTRESVATPAARRQWRRALWALRTTPVAFADDGAQQCRRLLALSARPGHERALTDDQRHLLAALRDPDAIPDAAQFERLAALREQCLSASRPDWRAPALRTVLDEAGARLLDDLLAELDQRLRASPAWGHLTVLADYLDALHLQPQRIEAAVRSYASVLGATCQQAASERMRNVLGLDPKAGIAFDTVVVDEAARASPLDLLIPMAMGRRRIVLVGDHRQLPHLLDPATEAEMEAAGELDAAGRAGLRESLFERLVIGLRRLERNDPQQPRRVVMLDAQFRMHPRLGQFVSQTFYESEGEEPIRAGRPAADFAHAVPDYEGCICAWIDVPASDRQTRDRRHGSSRVRKVEAVRVATEAKRILEACPQLSIGVITFYTAQREQIFACMAAQGLSEQHDGQWRIRPEWQRDAHGAERLRVGSVDAFQGMEFDVVLLSIVRTDARLGSGERESALNRKYGFLRLANRLNVAMSRQRRLLIAIGDAALARAAETAEAAPGLADFMRLCESEHGRVL
ncbi:DEAD/DEAH box helicase [Plasticicumulans sp.]|uniref:DEAD/DEAH box helicase n=1 Tax=Plasticicumulans sp. TaxID=2307179 RepID=UPI003922A201